MDRRSRFRRAENRGWKWLYSALASYFAIVAGVNLGQMIAANPHGDWLDAGYYLSSAVLLLGLCVRREEDEEREAAS